MPIPILRPYQQQLVSDIRSAWSGGHRNVMAVSATGSGKTVVFASLMREEPDASVAIAHRQELVTQMSLALARNGVRHRIIGQPATIRQCVQLHMLDLGISYYNPDSPAAVAGVDTLIRMDPAADRWFQHVKLWICDEGHHLARDTSGIGNKWGRATEMFPNARGLAVTATPLRSDGKGLGRHHDGYIDEMILAPSMREIIDMGYLTDYRIFAPPNDLRLDNVPTTAGGDFSPEPLRAAVHGSHIHGDVVSHYLKVAAGKLGVTFAVDVESATELAAAYRSAGVPAECINAKTPANVRYQILQMFARGDIKQLCNVDVLGEGFDLPAIEVVSMARPTQSYGLFVQQFGRSLRLMEDKQWAIVLDHVSNVMRHGLPDAPREWTLDRRERRSSSGERSVMIRVCPECTGVYERYLKVCPYCEHEPVPVGRCTPEMVLGDLGEMSPELLARLRGEIESAAELRIPYNATPAIEGALRKHHRERLSSQSALKEAMARWGGAQTARGLSVAEAQRLFYLTYGTDVLSAQTLNARDAAQLMGRLGV